MLRALGLRAAQAVSGQEALDWLRAHPGEASAVLLDFGMPGMDGLTCFRRLRELDPSLPVLVSSGYAEGGQIQVMIDEGGALLLPKPYTGDELARAVFTAVASRR
jgi:CheY-like chemotaxis protein